MTRFQARTKTSQASFRAFRCAAYIAATAVAFSCALLPYSPVQAADQPISFTYKGYTGGLYAAKMNGSLDTRGRRFDLQLNAGDAGISSLVNWAASVNASGAMTPEGVGPQRFSLQSTRRKKSDSRTINYNAAGAKVSFSNNPTFPANEVITESDTQGSLDPGAAFLAILNYVDQTGNCSVALRVFDGKSLYRFDVQTLGTSYMNERRLVYKGQAVHCRVLPVPIAGKATRPNSKAKMATVNMWVGKPVSGGPMMPVKLSATVQGIPITLLMTSVQ